MTGAVLSPSCEMFMGLLNMTTSLSPRGHLAHRVYLPFPPPQMLRTAKRPTDPDYTEYSITTPFHPRTLPSHLHPQEPRQSPEHEPQPSTIFLSVSRRGKGGWSASTRYKHGNLQRQTDRHSRSLARP